MSTLKKCCRCKQFLDLSLFGPSNQTKDGFRKACRECHRKSNAESRARNLEKSREATRAWQRRNPDKAAEKMRRWKEANPGRHERLIRAWNERNKESLRALENERRKSPEVRIMRTISQRIRSFIKDKAGYRTVELVGYGPEELKKHLERQFLNGMSWDNYGEWHIDHITPLKAFTVADVARAWALPNLRPLWAADNISKRDKRTHLI